MIPASSQCEAAVSTLPEFDPWKGRGPRPSALLELHRHSLLNVLVLGGTPEARARVARAFHDRSPLRTGPFVAVDAAREEGLVRDALLDWLQFDESLTGNPLRASERGTLFLDNVEALSGGTQRLLLALGLAATRGNGCEWRGRLISGATTQLGRLTRAGRFQAALFDVLDKVRIELTPQPGV